MVAHSIDKSAEVKRILRHIGLHPRRARGQSFLTDERAADELVSFCKLEPGASVLEIGPGLGVLTRRLIERGVNLTVVEIERALVEYLSTEVCQGSQIRVIASDVREVSLEKQKLESNNKWIIVGNIPYSISTDIVFWLIENRAFIERAYLLFQAEFAERITAQPGGRDYGRITVHCALYTTAERGPKLPGSAFTPPVKVNSQFVELRVLAQPRVKLADETLFFRVVRSAFSARRKTLLNSLVNGKLFASKVEGADLLHGIGIDSTRRPETLSIEEFALIAEALGRGALK